VENPFAPDLLVEEHGAVRLVRFNRPETMNAVTASLHAALARIWRCLAEDPGARVAVVTGSGAAFSAGGDLDHLVELHEDPEMRRGEGIEATRIVREMLGCRLPIVSAVNGPAVGLGASVAVLADVVYMAESAYLSDPHVAIGLTAGDGGAAVWPLLASPAQVKELLFTGDRVSAPEAVRLGLATRVVPDDELLDAALATATRLAGLPRQAVESTKRAVNMRLLTEMAGALEYGAAAEFASFDTPEHRARFEALRRRTRQPKGAP